MGKRITQEEIDIVRNLTIQGCTTKYISNQLNRTENSIHNIKTDNKIYFPLKLDDKTLRQYIVENIEHESPESIGIKFGCTKYTVYRVIKKYNISYTPYNSIRDVKTNPFDVSSKECDYWIGFLLADGHIKDSRVELSLAHKDREHLEVYSSFVGKEMKVYKDCSRVIFHNIKAAKFLKTLGLNVHSKTYGGDKFDYTFNFDILRGLIDGDGHVHKSGAIEITTANRNIADSLELYFNKNNMQHSIRSYKKPGRDTVIYSIRIFAGAVRSVFDELYYKNCVKLKRKYKKCESAVRKYRNKHREFGES